DAAAGIARGIRASAAPPPYGRAPRSDRAWRCRWSRPRAGTGRIPWLPWGVSAHHPTHTRAGLTRPRTPAPLAGHDRAMTSVGRGRGLASRGPRDRAPA